MESNGRKADLLKPIFLKAGIPLAISVAGFIYSMTTRSTTRRKLPTSSSPETQLSSIDETDTQEDYGDQESFHGLDSTSLPCEEDEEQLIEHTQIADSLISWQIQDRPDLEEEILGLKRQVSALQDRELELETRFLRYCRMKEQESVLMELQNMLVLEMAHAEFLDRMVESMEIENRKLEVVVVEFLRVVQQLESARLENGLLQRKVKKLSKTARERSRLLCQQASVLQAREAEISRNREELEQKTQVIKDLNYEIVELKRIVDELNDEKKGLVEKLESLESEETSASSNSKKEEEETAMEDQGQLLTDLEQLKNDRATEVEELIYLRWINACLRHELLRNQEQQRIDQEEKGEQPELEYGGTDERRDHNQEYDSDGSSTVTEHGESCMGITTTSHKRPKLLHKLRKWVKGSEGCKTSWDEEHRHKCDGRRSCLGGAVEQHLNARKSCSGLDGAVEHQTPRNSCSSA